MNRITNQLANFVRRKILRKTQSCVQASQSLIKMSELTYRQFSSVSPAMEMTDFMRYSGFH